MDENAIETEVVVIDAQEDNIIDVEVSEAFPTPRNEEVCNHALLEENAHAISAITGLRQELDDIAQTNETLTTENKNAIDRAVAVLDEQVVKTDALSESLRALTQRVANAETNIISATYVADQAYGKAQNAEESSSVSEEDIKEVIESLIKTEDRIDELESAIELSDAVAEDAKKIADSAVEAVEASKNEAINRANDAWEEASQAKKEARSLCAEIDQYSVGEYSQAYGLTREQASRNLQSGMIYVPTRHTATEYHQEEYAGSEDGVYATYTRWFTPGYLYQWGQVTENQYGWLTVGENFTETDEENYDPTNLVAPAIGPCVFFSQIEPTINPSDEHIYWYTDGDTITASDGSVDKYSSYTLYKWEDDGWRSVATLYGNTGNRMVSDVYQTARQISMDVVNVRGSVADLDIRVTDTEAATQSLAEWQNGGEVSKAIIRQEARDGASSIVISTLLKTEDEVTEQASMVLSASKDDGSALVMSAENIDFEAGNFTINADHIDLNGATTFNNNVTIGEDGKITAVGGAIGGWQIDNDSILSDKYIEDDGSFISGKNITGMMSAVTTPKYEINGQTVYEDMFHQSLVDNKQSPIRFVAGCTPILDENASPPSIYIADNAKFMVLNDGSLYANAAQISGRITADSGLIGNLRIQNNGLEGCVTQGNNEANNFRLNSNGLEIVNDSAKVQVGNICLKNKGEYTLFSAQGKMSLQSGDDDNPSAYIRFGGVDVEDVEQVNTAEITIHACAHGPHVEFYAESSLALPVVKYITFYYFVSGLSIWNAGYPDTTTSVTLSISPGETTSDRYDVDIRLPWSVKTSWLCFSCDPDVLTPDIEPWQAYNQNDTYKEVCLTDCADDQLSATLTCDPFVWSSSSNNFLVNGNIVLDEGKTGNLGSGDSRWYAIFAETIDTQTSTTSLAYTDSGTVDSSDKNVKRDVEHIPDSYSKLFDALKPVRYKYIDNTSDRYHTGFVAQDVLSAVEGANLTSKDFAAYCEWDKVNGEHTCGLRYSEFIALCVNEIQKLKPRVSVLEEEVAQLKKQIELLVK